MDDYLEEAARQKDYSWRDFAPSLRELGSGFVNGIAGSLINNAEFVGGFGAAGVDLFGISMPGTFGQGFSNTNNLLSTTESLQALSNQTFAYDRNGIGNSIAYGLGMCGTEAAIAYMTRGGSLVKHLSLLRKGNRIVPEAHSTFKLQAC